MLSPRRRPRNDDNGGLTCVVLPVLDVDAANAAHQQLQLPLVEDLDEVEGDELVEAGEELVHLLPDSVDEPPLYHQLDVLVLVIVGHPRLLAAGPQLHRHRLPEVLLVHLEGELQLARVVLLDPDEGVEIFSVHGFHVLNTFQSPTIRL